MKKKLTTILAMFLCAIMTLTAISPATAYAAENTTLKVTYKKKTVTFTMNENGDSIERVKLKTLKKKWNEPTKTEKGEYTAVYEWKKGDTHIRYVDNYYIPNRSCIDAYSSDKNLSICGLKVGLKESKVKKIMKKLGGEKDSYGNYGASLGDGRIMISCTLEKGKVTFVNCTLYVEDVSK